MELRILRNSIIMEYLGPEKYPSFKLDYYKDPPYETHWT